MARQNLLGAFEEQAFEYGFEATRILTRDVFLANVPEGVQFFLSAKNESFERKGPLQRQIPRPLIGDSLFINDGDVWRQRRRLIGSTVHVAPLPHFALLMVETACETRNRWAALGPASDIDVQSETAQLTAEIICRTIFGCELGRDRAMQVVQSFTDYQHRIHRIDLLSLFGLPDWVPRLHLPGVYWSAKRIHRIIDEIIAGYGPSGPRGEPSIIGDLLNGQDKARRRR